MPNYLKIQKPNCRQIPNLTITAVAYALLLSMMINTSSPLEFRIIVVVMFNIFY
jgi:hypothetical protein